MMPAVFGYQVPLQCGLSSEISSQSRRYEHEISVSDEPRRKLKAKVRGLSLTQEALEKADRQGIIDFLQDCPSLLQGERIQNHIEKIGLADDTLLGNLLVRMYDTHGLLDMVHHVFDRIPQPCTVSWNSIIGAYSKRALHSESYELYCRMQQCGMQPDKVTFLSLLSACVSPSDLEHGKMIHASIFGSGYRLEVRLGNALINMYAKCGQMDMARYFFDKMQQRSTVSWNAMISRYSECGYTGEALKIYKEMWQRGVQPSKSTFISILGVCTTSVALEEGRAIHASIIESGFESDVVIGTALVNLYAKCACPLDAWLVFDRVQEQDVALWSAIISAYAQEAEEALHLFVEMQKQGIEPDKVSFINVLNACECSTALEEGELVHAHITHCGFESDVIIGNALVNMYGKCGSLEKASSVFGKMKQHNAVSWNALVAAYSLYGDTMKVCQLVQEMQQGSVELDALTFVSLLSAYSRAGLVEEGQRLFCNMCKEQKIKPELEHYNCIVDLLGRAGNLDEAEGVIHKMPIETDIQIWMTLLGACRLHGDSHQGEQAAKRLLCLTPDSSAAHMLLFNIHAATRDIN